MRPFRFGLSLGRAATSEVLAERARRAEEDGFDILQFADHLGLLTPLTAAVLAAHVTERIRVGTYVLNNDFRHPGLLAQDAATADVLSDGRLELGLGAGHMRAEYEAVGLDFAPASERIDRLAEAITVLRRLFAGEEVTFDGADYRFRAHTLEPAPPQGAKLPLLVGGNGTRLLTVAGRQADIVGFTGFRPARGGTQPRLTHFTTAGLADRIGVVRAAAGERFDALELSVLVQQVIITPDRRSAAEGLEAVRAGLAGAEDVLDSPFLLIGTAAQIAEQLRALRAEHGVSSVTVFAGRSDGFERVVEELHGR